jgi:hypothetical protein
LQTLLKLSAAALLAVFAAHSAIASEREHRHFTHEKGGKFRTLPLTFKHGDPFKAIESHKGFKAHFEGPGVLVFKHTGHHHLLAAP